MQISSLMPAYEAPMDAWLAVDTGNNVYKITISQIKAEITGEQGGN